MDRNPAWLIAANAAFVGSHLLLAHPLRGPLVRRLGERGFPAVYVPVALATFAGIVFAFLAVGPGGPILWNGQSAVIWIVTSLLTILAMTLLPEPDEVRFAHRDCPGKFAG